MALEIPKNENASVGKGPTSLEESGFGLRERVTHFYIFIQEIIIEHEQKMVNKQSLPVPIPIPESTVGIHCI